MVVFSARNMLEENVMSCLEILQNMAVSFVITEQISFRCINKWTFSRAMIWITYNMVDLVSFFNTVRIPYRQRNNKALHGYYVK